MIAMSCVHDYYVLVSENVSNEAYNLDSVFFFFRIGLQGTKELSDIKIDKKTLQKGLLLEFHKDSERSLLAVVERPDGKKNWVVTDQVLKREGIYLTVVCLI